MNMRSGRTCRRPGPAKEQDGEGQAVGVDDPRDPGDTGVEVGDDRRDGDVDDGDVEQCHEHAGQPRRGSTTCAGDLRRRSGDRRVRRGRGRSLGGPFGSCGREVLPREREPDEGRSSKVGGTWPPVQGPLCVQRLLSSSRVEGRVKTAPVCDCPRGAGLAGRSLTLDETARVTKVRRIRRDSSSTLPKRRNRRR